MIMNNNGLIKTSLIISLIALAASMVTIILILTGTISTDKAGADVSKPETRVAGEFPELPSDIGIAYINLDTLLLEYKLAVKLQEDLLTQKARAQSNLESQYRQLEREYNSFMEKAQLGSFISQASMEAQQNELIEKQQKLERLDRQLTEDLLIKQEQMNRQLYDTIMNFMRQYEESHYTLVLGNAGGANVLYARPEMNVTREVIEALNKRYDKRQGK